MFTKPDCQRIVVRKVTVGYGGVGSVGSVGSTLFLLLRKAGGKDSARRANELASGLVHILLVYHYDVRNILITPRLY